MNSLKALQDRFQRAVVDGDDTILAELLDTSKEKRDTLLGVYRNAYVARLIEFLTHDYEKLHALLGDDQFDTVARAYIEAHPSQTPNARWYGQHLPEFLRTSSAYNGMPALADMAALEKALNDAFDAQDATILTMEDLAALSPEDWANLTFTPHPAVRRMEVTTNIVDIWRALNDEQEPPAPVNLDEPAQVVLYRTGGTAKFRVLAADEAMMWDEAATGVSFSVLCEMLAMFAGEDEAPMQAATYLKGWIESEMLESTS